MSLFRKYWSWENTMDITKLPIEFLNDMESILGEEYNSFLESYNDEPQFGLRVNRLKISVEDFLKICPFKLEPIPWTEDGFYFDPKDRPAKHPYYHGGLYYIQEPSAMAPAAILSAKKGDVVADLCAAPGGKSLQTASDIGEEGLIVSNDISASRLRALVKNVELAGVKNAIVICTDPTTLVNQFESTFDKILVDAPCSGEGMFRRDPKGIKNWSLESRKTYSDIQKKIMDAIPSMLVEGGICTYSTCTFTPEENEKLIHDFLEKNSDFKIDNFRSSYFEKGLRDNDINPVLEMAYRLWPHKLKGEGHFVARLINGGEYNKQSLKESVNNQPPNVFLDFIKENLNEFKHSGNYKIVNEKLILEPNHNLNLKGIRVLRSGWYLGDIKKNRFEPSQAFAMGLKKEEVKNTFDLMSTSDSVYRYLRGETINCDKEKGWILVTVDGYPLGWGKVVDKKLKNKYPASWRML